MWRSHVYGLCVGSLWGCRDERADAGTSMRADVLLCDYESHSIEQYLTLETGVYECILRARQSGRK